MESGAMRLKPSDELTEKGIAAIICTFSDGIDEMKRADQGDMVKVLRVLHKCKKFSVFEATDNTKIAGTMDKLDGVYFERTGGTYPWNTVELTRKGLILIGASVPEEPSNVIEGSFRTMTNQEKIEEHEQIATRFAEDSHKFEPPMSDALSGLAEAHWQYAEVLRKETQIPASRD